MIQWVLVSYLFNFLFHFFIFNWGILMTYVPPQSPVSQNTITLGIRFSAYEFRGCKYSGHSRKREPWKTISIGALNQTPCWALGTWHEQVLPDLALIDSESTGRNQQLKRQLRPRVTSVVEKEHIGCVGAHERTPRRDMG